MCGRFALFAPLESIEEYFETEPAELTLPPRYNLTPGQAVAVVREHEGQRRIARLRWGLVPFWAKDAAIGHKLVNARLDGLASKPAYREAFTRRRCLIPASGFYEWTGSRGSAREPWFVRATDSPLLAIAGLWERWRAPDGELLETCVIVTTDANSALAKVHDRMPVLVGRADHALWLNPRSSLESLEDLATRPPALALWPVTKAVNDPRRDDAALIERKPDES